MSKKPARQPSRIFLDDLRAHTELAQALGSMIVAWSSAERALLDALQLVSGLSPIAAHTMYFRMPTFETRVKVIQAMLEQWLPPDPREDDPAKATGLSRDSIEEFRVMIARDIAKLSKLSITRNGWVHASWTCSIRDGSVAVLDYREKLDSPKRRRPIKAEDVMNHIQAVHHWTLELRNSVVVPLWRARSRPA
jgi:hypothetical protein